MSFRKRNVALSRSSHESSGSPAAAPAQPPKGTRPSPVDGRLTTSTGTPSLDHLLAGHAGLALGSSVLLHDGGVTDAVSSVLLRNFAAEGVCQGHHVHVVGVGAGQQWVRELPGVVGVAREGEDQVKDSGSKEAKERMKIAWRYERLGQFDSQAAKDRGSVVQEPSTQGTAEHEEPEPFCHVFDLTKRLTNPAASQLLHFPMPDTTGKSGSPFAKIIETLHAELSSSPPSQLHRLIVPSILSPAFYPPQASEPQWFLQFLHAARGLLRLHASKLTALISLPLELYPRSSSLIRWAELLSDGVFELAPFPHQTDNGLAQTGAATALEERPQGMFKIHKLPVFHERGGGAGGLKGMGDDFAYTISRRRFAIKPFSLPPAEGDTDAQKGQADGGQAMPSKEKMEF